MMVTNVSPLRVLIILILKLVTKVNTVFSHERLV